MPTVQTSPPWSTMTSAKMIAGTATTMRGARSDPALSRRAATLPPAEPAPARRVLVERGLEGLAREVGPELVAEHELRVGQLPEQVVRDPQLAARSDQEVGVVHVRCVEVAAELILAVTREGSRCVHDLRPAAVVERHEQRDALVTGGEFLGPVHAANELVVQPLAAADEAHPNALLVQLRRLPVDPLGEHRHQPVDLRLRAAPVLCGEGVD